MRTKRNQVMAFVMALMMVLQLVFVNNTSFITYADETEAESSQTVLASWEYSESNLPSANEEGSTYDSTTGTGILSTTGKIGTESKNGISVSGWDNEATYWQLEVSTKNYAEVTFSARSKGSSTGPANILVEISTDGVNFEEAAGYSVTANFSTVTAELGKNAGDAEVLYIRLSAADSTSIKGETVASGGTNWLNNIYITGINSDNEESQEETEETTKETEIETEEKTTEEETESQTEEKTITSIADVKAAAEGDFTVSGTVTFIDGKNVYVEDSTGAIDLYFKNAPDVNQGDIITATGTYTQYKGLDELKDVSEYSVSGTAKLPLTVTTIDKIDETMQSKRVLIRNAVIGEVNTSGYTTLTYGESSVNIYKCPELEGISAGDTVNVYAIVGYYNGVQLRIAGSSDVVKCEEITDPVTADMILSEDVLTIDEFYATENTEVTVIGQVVFKYGNTGSVNTTIIEDVIDGEIIGVQVYSSLSGYNAGDVVEVTGTASTYGGVKQIQSLSNVKLVSSDKEALAAQEVTVGELKADPDKYMSEYVLIKDAEVSAYSTSNTKIEDVTGSINIYKAAAFPDKLSAGDDADIYAAFSKYSTTLQLRNGSSSDYVRISKDGEFSVDTSVVLPVSSWAGTGPYADDQTEIYADLDAANDQADTTSVLSLSNGKKPYIKTTSTSTGSTSYYMGATGLVQGEYYLIETSSKMYGSLSMTFSMRTSATGSKTYDIAYSTDGVEFTTFDTITISAKSTWEDFEVTFPQGADNAEKLYIKVAVPEDAVNFNGSAPGTGANNYFTTLSINGSPVVSDSVCGIVSVTPDAGETLLGSEMTMTTVTEDAVIYYSFDGENYSVYDENEKPVLSELPCTVTVYAHKDGIEDSLKVTYGYTQAQVSAVKASPNGGSVKLNTKVTLTDATEGAVIMYSFDNGETWNEYTDKITLSELPATLLVKGVKEGYKDSEITTLSFTERVNENYNIYFGQIHAHTSYSDGAGTCDEAFQYASQVDNLDFLAVTDHSNSFDNAADASISDGSMSTEWVEGHELADKYTTEDFVGLYGFEMTWSNGLGHINTFNTAGFQSRTQTEYSTYSTALQNYYATLKTDTGSISQFNHPGTTFGDFSDFAYYDDEIDELITLIEVGNGEGAVGSSGYFPSYEYYTRALDKGWHVAPTNNQDNHKGKWGDANTGRTVVLSDTLTQDNIYDALRNLRVYATEDNNLNITYKLNGEIMGTTLDYTPENVEITVDISDDDEEGLGTVEVIVNGGLSVASEKVTDNSASLSFELPADYSYYYIKVTQEDGDIAVTAPVWISDVEAVGISSISTDAPLAVAGQDMNVTTEIYNNESTDFEVSSIEYTVDDEVVYTVDLAAENISSVASCGSLSTTFVFNHEKPGAVNLYVTVKGTLDGVEKVYKDVLQLTFVDESMVTKVIIDGTHYNDYVSGYYGGNVGNFTSIAADENVEVSVVTDEITEEMLEDCSLLIISAPAKKESTSNTGNYYVSHFEDSFIEMVKNYTDNGGTLIVCGIADYQDSTECQSSTEINKLLEGIGATTRIYSDEAYDTVNNGGQAYRLYYTEFNTENEFIAGAVEGQTYSAYSGCTVDLDESAVESGQATWLVKGHDTTYSIDSKDENGGYVSSPQPVVVPEGDVVALGLETLESGANVFVAGSVFISDFEVEAELDNIWDIPYLNRTLAINILESVKVNVPVTPISEVRKGELGEVYSIEGYVTAGTSVEGNTFFDTIYVQDETGGITIFPYAASGLELGTKIRVTGYIDQYQGDKELQIITTEIIDSENLNVIDPEELSNAQAMDYDTNGGKLVKVTGVVKSVEESNGVVSQLVLVDENGDEAKVFIDGYIYSAETGVNSVGEFATVGATVSAVGLVYLHPEGDSDESVCVLRVRNTDEIVLEKEAEEPSEEETTGEETTETETETTEEETPGGSGIGTIIENIIEAIISIIKDIIKLFGRR